jgi:hypothetical protein
MVNNYMKLELAFSESLLLVQNYYLASLFVIYFTALACSVEKGWETHTHEHRDNNSSIIILQGDRKVSLRSSTKACQ